jgi:hypothetical protein
LCGAHCGQCSRSAQKSRNFLIHLFPPVRETRTLTSLPISRSESKNILLFAQAFAVQRREVAIGHLERLSKARRAQQQTIPLIGFLNVASADGYQPSVVA